MERTGPVVQALDAQVLSTTNFIQPNTTPLVGSSGATKATQEDNQKLFTLFQGVSQLATLASMASQKGLTAGQLQGYNTRFQEGLQQVESYISGTTYNNLTLQAQAPSASVTSKAGVPLPSFQYNGSTIVSDAQFSNALSGVSTSDSFNIAVTKGGTTTNVPIDLSQVQGPLSIGNIVTYVNQQLKAAGFSSTFSTNITSGSVSDVQKATYGIAVTSAPGEALSLSSASATPDLIVAGTAGSTTASAALSSRTGGDGGRQSGHDHRTHQSLFVADDAVQQDRGPHDGHDYGRADGRGQPRQRLRSRQCDRQHRQSAQSGFAGRLPHEIQLGRQSAMVGTARKRGHGVRLFARAQSFDGRRGCFRRHDSGSQSHGHHQRQQRQLRRVLRQQRQSAVGTADPDSHANQANAVTVDAQGNVYIGGSVDGSIGTGQTSSGKNDAYLAQLSNTGQIVSEQQFGTSGADQVSAMATTSAGDVVVASVQNGQAVLSKYASGAISGAPVWTMNLAT